MAEVVESPGQAELDRQQSLQSEIAEVVDLVLDGLVTVAVTKRQPELPVGLLGRLHL
jgi:hypothetical protein